MPRYFFNVQDGFSSVDEEGTELADVSAAQSMAIRTAGEILSDMGVKPWTSIDWKMEVLDERRVVLFILRFSAREAIGGIAPIIESH